MAEKTRRRPLRIAIMVVALVVAALAIYLVSEHYEADGTAEAALVSDDAVEVTESGSTIVFAGPDEDPANTYGVVFYPGAKVDARAYAPLLHELAREGWTCIDVSMPLDLAILDQDAADRAMAEHPEVEHWYVAGHSLGGAMAAGYASRQADKVEGLILLAAYSTEDLSDTQLKVVSIYGSDDGVLIRAHYDEDKANLPQESTSELVIEGGNHAQFGSYGAQDGDGVAAIPASQQRDEAVRFIDSCLR